MAIPQTTFLLYLILLQRSNAITLQEYDWKMGAATPSKETNSPITTEGACGYGDVHGTYGKHSAGLSSFLFNRGSTCGGCFEVRCVDHILWCRQGSPSVILTATDFCPPNYGLASDYGGWCNFPRPHFEMSEAAFVEIAERTADYVPLARNWGQNWHCNINLHKQPLSFEVTASSGKTITSYNVAPSSWLFGQTFEGRQFQN